MGKNNGSGRSQRSKRFSQGRNPRPVKWKREGPRAEQHLDVYAASTPGSDSRQHRNADGTPKRQFATADLAESAITIMRGEGKTARYYLCPVCSNFHLTTKMYD